MSERKSFNYKPLLVIPIILLLVSVGILVNNYNQTGEWFERSIELKGGTLINIGLNDNDNTNGLESVLTNNFGSVSFRELSGLSGRSLLIGVEENVDTDAVLVEIENFGIDTGQFSVATIGSSLGDIFWYQAQIGLVIAFIFMGIIVMFIFRTFVPSMAVIISAVSDIIITLAIMQVFHIDLSLAGFAALLMIIGYSVDTDILLTTRMLKGTGTLRERVVKTLKTGLTMSVTSIGALTTLLIFGISPLLAQIASVLLIGLIVDIIITWLLNASILRWYMERKGVA
ncbi:MAG: protein translocase subunit SecF [Candidatus Aenigmatarchaeota archaeon]